MGWSPELKAFTPRRPAYQQSHPQTHTRNISECCFIPTILTLACFLFVSYSHCNSISICETMLWFAKCSLTNAWKRFLRCYHIFPIWWQSWRRIVKVWLWHENMNFDSTCKSPTAHFPGIHYVCTCTKTRRIMWLWAQCPVLLSNLIFFISPNWQPALFFCSMLTNKQSLKQSYFPHAH